MRNVTIQYIDIANVPGTTGLTQLIIVLEAKPNFEGKVLVAEILTETIGYAVGSLLTVLERPSLFHVKGVAAVVDIQEDTWTIYNLFDETKSFNISDMYQRLDSESGAATEPS